MYDVLQASSKLLDNKFNALARGKDHREICRYILHEFQKFCDIHQS
jgi:hypothetical protein